MMKTNIFFKLTLAIIFSTAIVRYSYSQDAGDIFTQSKAKIVWLGVDFTQVQLIGPLGTVSPEELLPLFDQINELIVNEWDKFNFREALRKRDIPYDLGPVAELNAQIDPYNIIIPSASSYDRFIDVDQVAGLVKQYDTYGEDGIGLVFFMEYLDKNKESGAMWMAFFRLSDQRLLLAERMKGAAGGMGFRNHWANCVFEVITQLRDRKFEEMKGRYCD
jgi:hypothetical protein